ncbi:MAG: ThuA domain-containing protein [Planctomycetaceae bacterium]
MRLTQFILTGLLCCTFLTLSIAETQGADQVKTLMVTQAAGFVHGSVNRGEKTLSPAEIAMTQLAQQSDFFDVDCTQDCAADFTKDNLQNYDLVMFYTTGNLPIAEEDLDYFFKEWLPTKGHGVIGVHSTADTFHEYEPFLGHDRWNIQRSPLEREWDSDSGRS